MRKRLVCTLLALLLALSLCAPAAAEDSPALPPIEPITAPGGAEAVPVYLDSLLLSRAWAWGDMAYVALQPLCVHRDIDMDWSGDGQHLSLTLGTLQVEGEAGRQYYIADGRYIYAPEDWYIYGDELYLPVNALCKLLNLRAEWADGALRLDGSRLQILEGGEDYYDLNFSMEDVYWLSHIIGSEAGIEPLEGKIGVGNVVLNRVKDPDFPDTVFGVVYDYEHTIQFEPVSKGTIHDDPKPDDLIAAYLVLEGADTAGNCIYFVNPDFGSYWFDNNLDFVLRLGRHNFYVPKGASDAGTSTGTDPASGS